MYLAFSCQISLFGCVCRAYMSDKKKGYSKYITKIRNICAILSSLLL